MLVKNPYVWSSISVSTNYQLIDNILRLQGGLSLMDNKSQLRSQLLSLRAGGDYKLQNNVSINIVSFLRFNYLSNNQGLDTYQEGLDMSASGIICSINYNF
ncbi:MAG: hypothetical protein Ct9H90mP7_4150 [Candidatus Neomarinimicrobiota bacterium]|nr:MAG: hypothetical protein Ct9H90mP7_4150 [Candidatus Neomarinimicrobiota bacterium]